MMAARPFAERMSTMVSQIVGELGDEQGHEMLLQRGVERMGIIVVTADRGLCGGFNANATRVAQDLIEQEKAAGHEVVALPGEFYEAALLYVSLLAAEGGGGAGGGQAARLRRASRGGGCRPRHRGCTRRR